MLGLRQLRHDARSQGEIPLRRHAIAGGTALTARVAGISVCGKTGTAQNPHGKDHAWFIGFAPRENPKIAICVLVENAGFGGVVSAPIASMCIEQYFYGQLIRNQPKPKSTTVTAQNLSTRNGPGASE